MLNQIESMMQEMQIRKGYNQLTLYVLDVNDIG